MKRGFFVTGTGTGVGKTFVTALIAKQAVAAGLRVFAFKPIETGCLLVDGRRVGEDQEVLAKAAGGWQQDGLRSLYAFERPLAPLAAAQAENTAVDLFHVEQVFATGSVGMDVVLVEGAGGWRVPITPSDDIGALAKRLGLPIVLVGAAGLGTINHSVLTAEAIQRDGCVLEVIVLSRRPEDALEFSLQNAREIARLTRCRVVLSDHLDIEQLVGSFSRTE